MKNSLVEAAAVVAVRVAAMGVASAPALAVDQATNIVHQYLTGHPDTPDKAGRTTFPAAVTYKRNDRNTRRTAATPVRPAGSSVGARLQSRQVGDRPKAPCLGERVLHLGFHPHPALSRCSDAGPSCHQVTASLPCHETSSGSSRSRSRSSRPARRANPTMSQARRRCRRTRGGSLLVDRPHCAPGAGTSRAGHVLADRGRGRGSEWGTSRPAPVHPAARARS